MSAAPGEPSPPPLARVVVVGQSSAMRMGIRALLSSPGIEVVEESVSFGSWAASAADVDVAVVGDARLLAPVLDTGGSAWPRAIVVFGEAPEIVSTLRSLGLSGWGVVSLDASAAELRAAVLAVAQGLAVLPPALVDNLRARDPTPSRPGAAPLPEELTPREREVLELVSEGLTNKAIAERLHISDNTVKFHVAAIIGKLGASSRTDAVARGIRHGLVRL